MGNKEHTYFAPAERAAEEDLTSEVGVVKYSPVLEGLLHSINGLLAILNEQRQILAINDSFLKFLGIDNPEEALGLRTGEALKCVHSHEEPGGCGTSKFCPTCGAAIAIVSALENDKPEERICALKVNKNKKENEIALMVKAHPIKIQSHKFILLFIQDITREEQRAALERTFFHDINNMLQGLLGASELLETDYDSEIVETIQEISQRLYHEIAIQSCLSKQDASNYKPMYFDITVAKIFKDILAFFEHHSAARNKKIIASKELAELSIKTDISLLLRVLCNMVTNALEATEEKGAVKISAKKAGENVIFEVWNKKVIPPEVQLRIFQRNFSTKTGDGRGIGTFSMKLFGEKVLRGKVDFRSTEESGTTFSLSLPL